MASAITKAFGITEIVELILINIENPRELFRLQRVSHMFYDTAQGSVALRRLMGLIDRMPLGDETPLESLNPFLSPVNMLDFGPFLRRSGDLCFDCPDDTACASSEPCVEESPHGEVLFHFLLNPEQRETCERWNRAMGFTTNHEEEDRTWHQGSWRGCKISLTPKALRICIWVLVPGHVCDAHGLQGRICYREDRRDPIGEVALGAMIDVLEAVRGRSDEQHYERSTELYKDAIVKISGFDSGSDDGEWENGAGGGDRTGGSGTGL